MREKTKIDHSSELRFFLAVGGVFAIVTILGCGMFLWFLSTQSPLPRGKEPGEVSELIESKGNEAPKAKAAPPTDRSGLFRYDDIPLPAFSNPRDEVPTEKWPEVRRTEVALGDDRDGYYETPGVGGVLWVYLPPGEHAAGSLPCVLIPGARYGPFVAARLSELEEKHHAQFVQAGVAVVAYELDGRNNASFGDDQMMRKQYDAFKDSCAGLVNARNALEYVLGHIQAVDSTKVFAAGLGYGATHALLFAAHDARLAGVIAIHPTVDLRSHPGVESLDRSLPIRSGVRAFSSQCSPQTHVAWIRCPTYLFMETTKETLLPSNKGPDAKAFATKLKEQGTEVTYQMVESPELLPTEYNFSRGIDWLHGQLGWKK